MIKTFDKVLFSSALFFILAFSSAMAAPAPKLTAQQLLDTVLKTYESVKSQKYTWATEGMDTFTKKRQKDMSGNYDGFAQKAGVKTKVEDKPKLVRGEYEMKFMKPYLQQMLVVRSDFTPKIVWGTKLTFRSDKDINVWWAKPKISPIAIKRSVERDDAGGALTSNLTVTLLNMIYYAGNAELSLRPDAVFDGHPCYVLRYTFVWNKRPTWNHRRPPFDAYDVPEPIRKLIWKSMLEIESQKDNIIDYYIDKERFIVLNSEEYINGTFHWRNSFKNMQINVLTEKDF